jgi:DNA-binding GntR family transcriptional regulator
MSRAPGRIDVASVADRVYAALREQILAGDLEPESRLHQEGISAELGVSRTPVREALSRLAEAGLVDLLPNRGARVRDLPQHEMAAAYEARLAIEPPAARLAAERRPRKELAAMRRAVAAHRSARGDVAASYAANRDFHLALVAASGNPFLIRFAETLWAGRLGLRIYEQQRETPERIAADAEAHEELAAAIADGDGQRAEELLRAHIVAARGLLDGQLAA